MRYLRQLLIPCTLFLISTHTACTKKDDSKSIAENLVGTWIWNRTDGGIANNIHDTPQSTGIVVEIKFTNDNHYFTYRNGILDDQGTYSLGIQQSIRGNIPKTFITFSSVSTSGMIIESIDNLNLVTSDNTFDGLFCQYSKK